MRRVHAAAEVGLRKLASEANVDAEKRYPILSSLVRPFCKRHRKTLALVMAACAAYLAASINRRIREERPGD